MADQVAKPRRLWRIVLVVSLALNLAVVGVVTGAALSGRLGKGPPRAFDLGLGPLARTLDQQERRAIGATLRRDGDLRRVDMRGQMQGMIDLLRQEPFDAEALRARLGQNAERLREIQGKAQGALVEQISAMTPARRAEFADRLERELLRPRRPPRSGG